MTTPSTNSQGVLSVRESTGNIPAARRVRDVADTILYLDPNENPFTLLSKASNNRTATNSKFEWMEKNLPSRVSKATDTSSTTAVPVTAGTGSRFNPQDVVLNSTSGELYKVTSIATDTLTVVRGVGTVSATANVIGDDLIIIGSAYPEGAGSGTVRSTTEGFLYNYTQIFRTPFGTTGTEEVSENYGGKDRPRLRKEKGIDHAMDIERAFLYGNAASDTSTSGLGGTTATPWRTTAGILSMIATNSQAAGGTLTEPEMETFCQSVFTATGAGMSRSFFVAPGVMSVIDQIAAGRLQTVPDDKTFGIAVEQWRTSHGTLNIIKHRLLVGSVYSGYGIAVDTNKLTYAKLTGRDTMLRENIQSPDADAWTDEFLTECGFQLGNESAHGVLTGVSA